MNPKHYNDYQILRVIEQQSDLSQRLISQHTGINVASVNFAVKRLILKGYIKATNMNKKRIMYHLTPSGLAQKAKLAYNSFLYHYHLFSDIREIIALRINAHPGLEGRNMAIFGLNEITEIVYIAMKKKGIDFSGVFEDDPNAIGTKWLGEPVQSIEALRGNSKTHYLVDVKAAASNILSLKILPPKDFFKTKIQNSIATHKKSSKFELKILGSADTVVGSCVFLKVSDKKILIDCGLCQGKKEDERLKKYAFPFDPSEVNYLFLTHAHLDHSGGILQLIDQGFKGEILCHHATADTLTIMLKDALKSDDSTKYNLSNEKLLEKCVELSWGFEYGRWNKVSKGISFRFFDAGHVIGSSTIQLDLDGEYLVFSGDIGNRAVGTAIGPVVPDRADILVLESTCHADHERLLNWVDGIQQKPHTIYLNNGEPEGRQKLEANLAERYPMTTVHCGFEVNAA
jgi:glyoxylase-like metal-dependent hydrolase (beta-lactamase superfamily II)/DNA-binding MarR family transcriptional regulator